MKMFTLAPELRLQKTLTKENFDYIQDIIKNTDLSSYLLDSNDFFIIKNKADDIISFGRIYPIEKHYKELSSVRVEETYRGQKVGLYLCSELIKSKKGNDSLFLATKESLAPYYQRLGFETIVDNIPEKLIHTGIRAREHGIEFVIMKYIEKK